MPGFVELHGDRAGSDERHVRIGLGQLDGVSLGVVCVNRAPARSESSTGYTSRAAAGYRKACRLYRLAALFELPVVTLVDGLEPQIELGASGGEAGAMLAQLSRILATLPVPAVSVILGEVNGSHAMAYSLADRTLMLEHAVFSTSSIDHSLLPGIGVPSTSMPVVLTSRDCRRFGLVDSVIPEPLGGAHEDPPGAAQQVRLAVTRSLGELAGLGPRRLQDERSRKYRQIGLSGAAGTEAVWYEIAQLQDLQRTVGRSIDGLRDRIEQHHLPFPSLPHLPPRPGIPAIQAAMRPNLPSIKRPTVNRAEIADLAVRLASTGRDLAERMNDVRTTFSGAEPPAADRGERSEPDGRSEP